MMALGGTVRSDPLRIAQEMARHVLLHPVLLATALGLVFLAFGIRLPEAVETALSVLGAAAPAAALFALGLALSFRPLGRPSLEMPAVVLAKLVVHPFIAYLLLSWVGGFDRIWVSTAVLLAALPPALDVLSMAQRYRVPADRAATAIGVAMIASVVTVTVALILLVNGLLPSDPFR